jgi:predicted P-loop ATPase
MNELIRECWLKAAREDSGEKWDTQEEFIERFAELIVEECADVLRAESERLYKLAEEEKDEVFASNFEICAEKCWDNEVAIKIHFGVKPFGVKE